jgi:BNR repeat-like domain
MRLRLSLFVLAFAAVAALVVAAVASANVALVRVSSDPFTNTTSQHATEVEPDTFAFGSTVVGAFQVGRFFDGGGTDIGVVRSGDGGHTWGPPGFLPGMTTSSGAANTPFERVSDASVAYDSAHATWLISSIPIPPDFSIRTVLVNRSTDDGQTWSPPVSIPSPVAARVALDKNWTVCDNGVASPFRGHCYTEFDNFADHLHMLMSTSTDGGQTWSAPIGTASNDKGIGGQPLVQPNGTVVVPYEDSSGKIAAFRSTDGGATWKSSVQIAGIRFHGNAGGLRTSPLPTAEVDGSGKVYVAWEDCRFEKHCSANDIVFSASSDGVHWSAVARVPIDPVGSGADHFIPGLAVDPATSGSGAHLALTYYYYPDAACTGGCQLDVGYISSPDGGAHWGNAQQLAGPMQLSQIAQTSQGPMTGDYISTSFSGGSAVTMFPVGMSAPPGFFDEAMYAPASPLAVASSAAATNRSTTTGVFPLSGVGTGETHHDLKAN